MVKVRMLSFVFKRRFSNPQPTYLYWLGIKPVMILDHIVASFLAILLNSKDWGNVGYINHNSLFGARSS